MLKVGQEKSSGSTIGRGAGFAATKSFIKNHERPGAAVGRNQMFSVTTKGTKEHEISNHRIH
jgi:hypothetical protein